MGLCVVNGAQLLCSFGTAPVPMVVLPAKRVMATMPAATITDNVPMMNIMPFAMCNSPANPATKRPPPVFFTPAPCVPATASPWAPGSTSCLIGGVPALDSGSKLMCNWGGVIQVVNPGQTKTIIGK
jgi:hypothetical protein